MAVIVLRSSLIVVLDVNVNMHRLLMFLVLDVNVEVSIQLLNKTNHI